MNYDQFLKSKLIKYDINQIKISEHALEQAAVRGVNIKEVKENIINPKRLVYARKQEAENYCESKFDCYFAYSKTQCHRYVLVINCICIVCTIIKIRRRWQRIIEKKLKK